LGDRRKNNGNIAILGDEALEELQQALSGLAPDGGLWNSPTVASGYPKNWVYTLLSKLIAFIFTNLA